MSFYRSVPKVKFSVLGVAMIAASLLSGSCLAKAAAVPAPPFTVRAAPPRLLFAAAIATTNRTVTAGTVSADHHTLTFPWKSIRLIVHTGPDNDMLSYRISGLRNPTLVVPSGATLRVLFVNDDNDMLHNLRFTTRKAPFASSLNAGANLVGTPELKPVSGGANYTSEVVLHVPSKPGVLTYLCTVPGHANGGMYGTIRVR